MLFLLIHAFILAGCSIQSHQLSSLIDMLDYTDEFIDYNWHVSYRDYQVQVYAVDTSEGILFLNDLGDKIFFDGWVIRNIQGLGLDKVDINIADEGRQRIIYNRNVKTRFKNCFDWEKELNRSNTVFVQNCDDDRKPNVFIKVNNKGSITEIMQIVDNKDTIIQLSKLEYGSLEK